MFQHIVAVRANPDGNSTFLDCSNRLSYRAAVAEEAVLRDFDGYQY